LAYADAVTATRPDLAPEVRRLLTQYAQLRYGVAPSSFVDEVREFEREVGALTVRLT
jgi:hypothetical protein